MKIRIKGNSVRFRLTKTEVNDLCETGSITESTRFPSNDFKYSVVASNEEDISIDYTAGKIILNIAQGLLNGWSDNNKIGFYRSIKNSIGEDISITLEKDFVCLDERGEDESDNYPNPKASIINE